MRNKLIKSFKMNTPKLNSFGTLDNKYNLLEKLNNDSETIIFKVLDNETNEIKVAKIFSENKILNYKKEINIIKKIGDSPFIIKYYCWGEGPLKIDGMDTEMKKYIILEYAEGSIFKFIEALDSGFSENTCKFIFYQLILAIKNLHERGICHRDIKLENLLFVGNEFSLRLCDFDMSTSFIDKRNKIKLYERVGSPFHYPPEIIVGKLYDGEKIDVFCAGVSLKTLMTRKFGFYEASRADDLYKFISRKRYNEYWEKVDKNNTLSKEFKELYIKMVAYNPRDRPSLDDILNCEWLKNIKNASEDELINIKKGMIEELRNVKF